MSEQPTLRLLVWEYYGVAIYLTLLGLFATFLNASALVVFIRGKTFRKQGFDILLINVTASDLGISIFGYPEATVSSYANRWMFGDVGCKIYAFFCFILSMSTISTLAVIGIYRYITVCLPAYKHKLTRKRTVYAILGVWAYGLLWTTPPLFGWCGYTYEPFGTSCSIDWYGRSLSDIAYIWGTIIFCFGIHLVILVWCYTKVIKRSNQVNPYKQPMGRQVERIVPLPKSDYNVSLMCMVMVASFVIVWTPYAVVSILSVYHSDMSRGTYVIPTMFAKSSCMMNPIIYLLCSRKYRTEFTGLFCRCCGKRSKVPTPQYYVRTVANTANQSAAPQMGSSRLLYNCDGVFIGEIKPKQPEYKELVKFEKKSNVHESEGGPFAPANEVSETNLDTPTLVSAEGVITVGTSVPLPEDPSTSKQRTSEGKWAKNEQHPTTSQDQPVKESSIVLF
ncbi:rhodopsin, G0-coupled-like [Ptychodera flava]|uniref:rhodopsin, G0-coupled-like n=1 Tax=Ptychodera flava TaxID=63121 RepID=UPI00396A310B